MNADRRKQISEAKSILESVRDDEQSAFDNLPEGLQQSERGQAMEQNVSYLDDAISSLESIE